MAAFSRIVTGLAVIGLVAGVNYKMGGFNMVQPVLANAPMQAPPPPSVVIQVAEVKDVPVTYEYSGRTAGSREVEIRPRVSGILFKRSYVEGQYVQKGEVLFEIDPAKFEADMKEAQAKLTQASLNWDRVQKLFGAKAASARERDDALAEYETARAALENAQINLEYTTVTAPISGITGKESLSEGSLVTADNSLLTRIVQLDPIQVNFASADIETMNRQRLIAEGKITMPENKILTAEIIFGDGTLYNKEGTVDFTDSIIDQQTGTVKTRAVFPNPDSIIIPGQFVRVAVKGFVRKNIVSIPDKAIMQGPHGPFVYIVDENSKAAVSPVVLGMISGTDRLIEDGLKSGDKVIIDGMIKVRPDSPVTIDEPKEKQG